MKRIRSNNAQKISELSAYVASLNRRRTMQDFMGGSAPWSAFAVAVGTAAATAGTAKHPGQYVYTSHVSNANSGGCMYFSNTSILMSGSEKSTILFKTSPTINGVLRRTGFHNSANNAAPSNGVYFKIADGVLTGQTKKATAESTTATNYTVSADTWYRGVIEVNADATLVTFKLYADDSNTLLWSDTLSTNIPTTAGQEVGYYDTCILASPSGATVIGFVDYIDIEISSARRV